MSDETKQTSITTADNGPQTCCICLESVALPFKSTVCSHVFCFLCIKGVAQLANENGDDAVKCPLCRRDMDYESVNAAAMPSAELQKALNRKTHVWAYSSRGGGWWLYDDRTSTDIEAKYQLYCAHFAPMTESQATDVMRNANPHVRLTVNIAYEQYVIDFAKQVQYSANHPSRCRSITRQLVTSDPTVPTVSMVPTGQTVPDYNSLCSTTTLSQPIITSDSTNNKKKKDNNIDDDDDDDEDEDEDDSDNEEDCDDCDESSDEQNKNENDDDGTDVGTNQQQVPCAFRVKGVAGILAKRERVHQRTQRNN